MTQEDKRRWFALYRVTDDTPPEERPINDMIVAWPDPETMREELEAYVRWDREATGTTNWDLVMFPRKERPSYFREHKDADDLIDYHFVDEDLKAAIEDGALHSTPRWRDQVLSES